MKKSELRKLIKEELKSINEGVENQIPALNDFMKFFYFLQKQLESRLDDEEMRTYMEAHENLSDALDHWIDEINTIERKYPS
jgi:hypothetical protein